MSRVPKRLFVVNIFGGLFYLFCLMQWLWAALPYLPQLISLSTKLQPSTEQPHVVARTAAAGPPSVLVIVLASIVVTIILVVTIYALVKLPSAIGKTGEKITKGASNYLIPVVSHHVKLTPKKRRALTTRVIIDIKLAICILPVVVVALGFAVSFSISYNITMLVAALFAMISLVLLSAQIGLAKWLHVPLDKAW